MRYRLWVHYRSGWTYKHPEVFNSPLALRCELAERMHEDIENDNVESFQIFTEAVS